jgi:hypothetical protein
MSKVEDKICEMIQSRAEVGLRKYGVSLERTDLSTRQWLQHLLEEQLDAAGYTMRLIMELDGEV